MKTAVDTLLRRRHRTTLHALEDQDARDFLHHQWPALYTQDAYATPYQAPTFLHGWATRSTPPTATPVVLVVDSPTDGTLAALALQREVNHQGRARLRPLGSPHAEYIRQVGPASNNRAVTDHVVRYLVNASTQASVVMPDLPEDTGLARTLATQPGWQHTRTLCARIPLPLDVATMSRSTRRDHARRERIWTELTAQGRVTYTQTQTKDQRAPAAATALQLHRRRWAGHPAAPDADPACLLDVLNHCSSADASVATLTLDAAPVAAMVLLHRGTVCYSLLAAMDPAHAELAPGHALIRRVAASLALNGYNHLDLGRTRPDPNQIRYKSQYKPEWKTTLTATGGAPW